jgi:NAD(P)-dependent dehydrogenase (short-subunit alcohol dehydrogenase family)
MNKQKSILITGVSGGIGSGIATYFKNKNYKVIGIDNTIPKKELLIDEFIFFDLNLYVLDEEYRKKQNSILNEKADSLHLLVNNAAVQLLDTLDDLNLTDWQKSLNVNLTAPMLLSQHLLPALEKDKGCIVNIGSIHQQLTKPKFISYATSKSALIGLTKALAVDLKGRVRVNSISPAAIETDMLIAGFGGNEEAIKALEKLHPVQRIGIPEDIARMVYFLSEENQGFIHGANFALDGGIGSVLHDL